MPRTAERGGPETRARIREVANRMFLERGYDAVTVAEVAREAGVSSVTVFNHFARKEDLFLDRVDDAVEFLRSAARDPDPLAALHSLTLRLLDERQPLSGIDERSIPFFRTVAGSSALVARSREIAAELQRTLVDELEGNPRFTGDAGLFAAFFIAGYSDVLVGTARRVLAGERWSDVLDDHRARIERMFLALSTGIMAG
jgi:AcrR family transcriptional regulator